ncbi:MAG TPA: glycosyltransferase family 1 protein [Chthoniobacterales bacterium]
MYLQCDVSRLLRRYKDKITHTGIDRVNLDYAKWVIRSGGGLCIQRGHQLQTVSRAMGRVLLRPSNRARVFPPDMRRNKVIALRRLLSSLAKLGGPVKSPASAIVLNTSHAWLDRTDVWSWLIKRGSRVVPFIHDLIPIEFPEYARPIEKKRHELRIDNALRHSAAIVVNSECTHSSLAAYADQTGLRLPPILVAPLGQNLKVRPHEPIPENGKPYFVFLGTIEPRKNHLLILTVWREMVKRLGENTPRLIVAGRRGWECEQIVDLLDRCEQLRPHVTELNNAPDEEIATLLKGARALLLPSFAEGFGMPIQEALAAGTPVIASPLPTFLEIAGDIPEYAEPFDGAKWFDLIVDYAAYDSIRRREQLVRMDQFQETTWKSHFHQLESFLRSLPRK